MPLAECGAGGCGSSGTVVPMQTGGRARQRLARGVASSRSEPTLERGGPPKSRGAAPIPLEGDNLSDPRERSMTSVTLVIHAAAGAKPIRINQRRNDGVMIDARARHRQERSVANRCAPQDPWPLGACSPSPDCGVLAGSGPSACCEPLTPSGDAGVTVPWGRNQPMPAPATSPGKLLRSGSHNRQR
jgi:hypothetical protein